MQKIVVSNEISEKIPGLQLACIECDVKVIPKNSQLWNKIEEKVNAISTTLKVEEISRIPTISASRKGYKACGKDPARYRLSAEALLRRIVNRGEIYQINNVVDLLNLVSISTGFSIGGYDVSKIDGDAVFGIGKQREPYTGIGRGELNIEGMPVFRDNIGAFGTPTSDSERTSVSLKTTRFLMVIIDYAGSDLLKQATEQAKRFLEEFASAKHLEINIVKNNEDT